MTPTLRTRLVLFTLLAAAMAATRMNHFGAMPDASWAVFFIAGFYLRGWGRWAFPLLMALAVAIDYAVISGQGTVDDDAFKLQIAAEEMTPANFDTIETVDAFVSRKLAG